MADTLMDAYFRAPPIARTLATAAFVTSVGLYTGILSSGPIIYHPYFLKKFPPQIWRVVTSFLITSPKLGMLFDTYFVFQYLSQLETGNPRFTRKEDLIWYLLFVSGTIVTITSVFGLPYMMFLPALIIAMCYTATQDQRGMKANFYFITIPAQLTPYCMILISLVFPDGVMAMLLQVQGLVAAHLFEFLTRIWPQYGGNGRSLLPTPGFLTTVVNAVSGASANIGAAATRAAGGSSTGSTTGASSGGPLPESWRTRGPGRRLG